MIRVSLAALLIVLGVGKACCQQSVQSSASETCSFAEIYRQDGWAVPGLVGAKAKSQRAKLSKLPGVFVTMLQPAEPETFFQHVWCPQDHPGRIEIENAPIKVLDLWSFDFGGRVFAYRVSYAREAMKDGVRSELAAASIVFFYDADGSGRFTVVRGGTMGVGSFAPAYIPEWAKSSTDPPKQP
jgi:hypothetical protein